MKAIICTGRNAKTPYYFDKLGIHVYSMEELCYCLKENAFLLSTDIMSDGLLRFISSECQLDELATTLYPIVHKRGSLSVFVSVILEYVGLYPPQIIQSVERTIRAGDGLSDYERQKRRIDYLTGKRRFLPALKEYESLYQAASVAKAEELPNKQAFLAALRHNQGVVYANLMRYEEAAKCFMEAFEMSEKEEELLSYLAARRMELPEGEYIEFVSGLMTNYRTSIKLEKIVEGLKERWLETPEYIRLCQMKEWRDKGEMAKYDKERELMLHAFKNTYRECMGE